MLFELALLRSASSIISRPQRCYQLVGLAVPMPSFWLLESMIAKVAE